MQEEELQSHQIEVDQEEEEEEIEKSVFSFQENQQKEWEKWKILLEDYHPIKKKKMKISVQAKNKRNSNNTERSISEDQSLKRVRIQSEESFNKNDKTDNNDKNDKNRIKKKQKTLNLDSKKIKKLQKMFNRNIFTINELCYYFSVSKTILSRYIKQYQNKGTLQRILKQKQKQQQIKLKSNQYNIQKTQKLSQAILQIINKNPKIYQFEIKYQLENIYSIYVSQTTISRCMRKIKLVKKKPTRIFIQSNTTSNIKRRYEYCQRYQLLQSSKCIFIDQCGINNRIKRQKGWVIKGQPFHCEQPADGSNKYSLLATMTFQKLEATQLKYGSMNTSDFVQFIRQKINTKYSSYTLILDNAKIHKTVEVKQILANFNIKYLYLPPYTPLLNPIENVFHQFKCVIRNYRTQYPSLSLKQSIESAIKQMYTKSFSNYQRHVNKWIMKGLRKQKFLADS